MKTHTRYLKKKRSIHHTYRSERPRPGGGQWVDSVPGADRRWDRESDGQSACLEVFFSEPDTRGRRLPVSGRVTDQQDELDSGRPPRSRGQRFALIFLTFEITVEGEGLVGNFGNVALD